MTDPTPTPDPNPSSESEGEPQGAPAGTDWTAEAKKWERRAKENKAAADELERLKEASKTDGQRQQEALEAATRAANEAQAALVRYEIAAEKGLPVDVLSGSTREELEAHADRLLKFRQDATAPRSPEPNPMQGTSGSTPAAVTPGDEFAAFLHKSLK